MKLVTSLLLIAALAGCGTSLQSTQTTYVQACSAYGAALSTAVTLRSQGKLSAGEISQITLLDSQVTPICTGSLPADPTAATAQVTAAVTSILLIEAAKKVSQ